MPAHPRSRGENRRPDASPRSICGSSPLTRGKLGALGDARDLIRLIPAHAGKTRAKAPCASAVWAHPRSRGENFDDDDGRRFDLGSSPLTRGKPRVD